MPWIVTGPVMKALIGVLVLFVVRLIYLYVAAITCIVRDENLGFRQRVAWVAAVIVVPVVGGSACFGLGHRV